MSAALQSSGPAPGRLRAALRLCGLCVLLAAAALFAWAEATKPEEQRYIADFDESVSRREPAVAAILASDPALREKIIRETKLAFDAGGWPAATERYQEMKRSLIQVYAGDTTTMACNTAWTQIIRDLLPTPALCRAYFNGDYNNPIIARHMTVADAPCNTALVDAGKRRAAGETPKTMSADEYSAAYYHSLDAPSPLSAQERAALTDPHADDWLMCEASLKLNENALAMPGDQAARFARTQLSMRDHIIPITAVLAAAPPPPSLAYAPAGTIFTLSIEGNDGRPITWTSLGQSGWDVSVKSSASTRQYLWGDDNTNPIRILWPLAIGKTAEASNYTANDAVETHHYAVASQNRYWLPFGWVTAYAIDDTVSIGGRERYVLTHYWSPDLGFKIGQHTVVKSGKWPDGVAADWQLIAMKKV
jgi:hypothetical protein